MHKAVIDTFEIDFMSGVAVAWYRYLKDAWDVFILLSTKRTYVRFAAIKTTKGNIGIQNSFYRCFKST